MNLDLKIKFPKTEYFDENSQRFITLEPIELRFEHSLYAISKWESVIKKPFFPSNKGDTMTNEELLFYIQCMIMDESFEPKELLYRLDEETITKLKDYISDNMTATWFNDSRKVNIVGKPHKEAVTSEMIYYYMFSLGIPIYCEHWPITRLTTLIRIFAVKNDNKPMSRREEAVSRTELNRLRREALHSKG